MADSEDKASYISDPAEIYQRSFALVEAETDLLGVPSVLRSMAIRLVHACGMPDIVPDLRWGGDPATAIATALGAGRPILADCEMVRHGIIRRGAAAGTEVLCTLNDPRVPDLAKAGSTTRSAAAVDLWQTHLDGAVVVIGNAPTALFRLLELLGDGAPMPAAIVGFPVGFVGAAESKALLATNAELTFITLLGRRGGSAMAAAAVNAISQAKTD